MMRRALVLLLFAASACGDSESARVTIDLAALYQHAAQAPASIDRVELTVVGEGVDLDPVTVDPSTLEFELEVPAGRARTFAIEAWQENAASGSERLTTYWGSSTHDLAPRTEADITIPIVPAGRVYGTISLSDDAAVPADVDLTFTASKPAPEVPGVITATASRGAFSVPLPVGQYSVTAQVVAGGTVYRLPLGTTVDILHGQLTGPVDLTLVASSQVTVTVATSHGNPVADATVLLNAADGTFKSQTATDPSGIALLDAASGDMVTLAGTGESTDSYTLTTVGGVEPGDVVPFEVMAYDVPTAIGTISISLGATLRGASHYRAMIGCNETTLAAGMPAATLDVDDDCVNSEGTVDLLVVAEDQSFAPLAVYVANGLPTDGASVTVDTWDATAIASLGVQVASPPPTVSTATIEIKTRRNATAYWLGNQYQSIALPAQQPTLFAVPTGFFDTVDVRTSYYLSTTSAEITHRFVSDTWPAPATADFSTGLPEVNGVDITSADPSRPEVNWTTAAALDAYAVVHVAADWSGTGSLHWDLMVAPQAAPLRFPEIPSSIPAYQPQSYGAATYVEVRLSDFGFLSGYRGWLTQIGPRETSYDSADYWPVSAGTVRRSTGRR